MTNINETYNDLDQDFDDFDDEDLPEIPEDEEPEDENENRDQLRIGIIGTDSDQDFDVESAYDELETVIDQLIQEAEVSGNTQVVIVSGCINTGITRVAYELAEDRGFKTVAIYPSSYDDEKYEMAPVDVNIEVSGDIGDDDEDFIDYVDALVVIGRSSAGDTETKLQLADEHEVSVVEIEL